MIRRKFISLLLTGMLVPAAGFAAETAESRMVTLIMTQLKEQGFTEISFRKTWLGRLRFDANDESYRREIVINPQTGEVLRDIWREIGSAETGRGLFSERSRDDDDDDRDRSSKRSGKDDDDDRDDDRDDDKDDDRDDEDDDDDDDDKDDRSGRKGGDDDDDDDD